MEIYEENLLKVVDISLNDPKIEIVAFNLVGEERNDDDCGKRVE